ncbi:PadR family transcriptional regulator [Bradyrhizobium sp.]|jgi:PadR family transcriptional regulator PadR|uniref:PadR family transcriptional regulator n=1 Tax=Bradyrhizobium sp. TaxID=376 RepID=UPI002BE90F01|nr:helix-turn-helix transcriptional regulator [Bradyrhizobium sp.]HWX62023.1 helix-turn-helix transcriptional regulator [Bradyrhizobium sp.]
MNIDYRQSSLDLAILAVLKAGGLHGYALITALRERSDGAFDLAEGTVYPSLHRLERAELIVSEWEQDQGRKRRRYTITRAGRAALAERRAEWHRFSRSLNMVLEWRRA